MKKLLFAMLFTCMTAALFAQQVDLSSGAHLSDAQLRLRSPGDGNHYLKWTGGTVDGPELAGNVGGRLGVAPNGTFSEVLRWNSSGNVGIGTTNPDARLHIDGGNVMIQQYEPRLILRNDWQNITGGNVTSIEFDNGTLPVWKIDARVSGSDELSFQNYDFATSSYIKVISMNEETVGIGTDLYLSDNNRTTSNGDIYRLYVKGGIKTEEVKVELGSNNNWADYVFAEDYDLLSLTEVEQHIQKTGHLHNIQSAAEIEEEGLELKSMTINQQEKIEELYLHMIEMDKRMKALEKENAEFKATLNQ